MSLAATQTLSKDTATDVDTNTTVFTLRAADIDQSIFSVSGLTLPAEKKLTVSHAVGKAGNQRHLTRIDRTEVDALLVPATLGVYLVIDRPNSTAITNAIVIEVVNQLIDFLIEGGSNANVTALLNNEV
jgi:enhancing lycopene biosynthesis protein 2